MTVTLGDVSPLHDIERTALDHAPALDNDHDPDALRRLATETVDQWSLDHRRGTAPPLADPDAIVERAKRNLTGGGPLGPIVAGHDL